MNTGPFTLELLNSMETKRDPVVQLHLPRALPLPLAEYVNNIKLTLGLDDT